MLLIALLSLVPLVVAPIGFVTLACLRGMLPDPWGTFRLDLLAWAIFAQASVGSFYLLINGLGHRAGQRYALALLLPAASVLPLLAQILVATTSGILLLAQACGRGYLRPAPALQGLESRRGLGRMRSDRRASLHRSLGVISGQQGKGSVRSFDGGTPAFTAGLEMELDYPGESSPRLSRPVSWMLTTSTLWN